MSKWAYLDFLLQIYIPWSLKYVVWLYDGKASFYFSEIIFILTQGIYMQKTF